MNEVLIVDPSYIDGMLNAKMITFSLSQTRALNFINITEAHEFSLKYGITPNLVLLDEKLSSDGVKVREWLDASKNFCPIHLVSTKNMHKEKDGYLLVNRDLLVDHVGHWFAN